MDKLKQHRNFRNQCIAMTILLFVFGGLLLMPFSFLAEDAHEGSATFFSFGGIMLLVSIYNIFSYNKNKKDYNKLKNL